MSRTRRITGHLVVEERKDGPRVWVAKYMRAEGTPTRKVLGATWAKPARTASDRGAPPSKRWRSADGPERPRVRDLWPVAWPPGLPDVGPLPSP